MHCAFASAHFEWQFVPVLPPEDAPLQNLIHCWFRSEHEAASASGGQIAVEARMIAAQIMDRGIAIYPLRVKAL